MIPKFKDKVAIVTGGASGIGEAVVRELAQEGANVVVADLNFEAATRVATEVNGRAFTVDVSKAGEIEAMVKFAVQTFGGLHYAVNNAGIAGPTLPTADYPEEDWRRVIDVNLNSVFFSMKYEIPAILASGGGAIVNMSSILGVTATAGSSAYTASKHAVVGLTKSAALEYSAKGIRINAVGPAYIETPIIADAIREGKERAIALHPIGRLGQPEEVAALTCFLLSDRASFMTGSYHLVDGGYMAQ